ncbi:MAG TPA: shikimate kinase [Phycisphaerae bacterium]|nr:shikimate kinase [Phycisphaerae bacterium]
MNVVLIGMKHCGKSTIGAALARRWGCPFYDVDEMIEATHACESGRRLTAREIFVQFGEDYFHKIEGRVVCELYMKLFEPDSTHVVALGGRTAMNEGIRELLDGIGLTVYLQVAPEELLARVKRAGMPPFLDEADPVGDFLLLCRQREPQYERLADLTVNLDGLDVEAAVDAVARCIEEHKDAR